MGVTVKELPMIFQGPMVRAILEDRKSMTRRPMKPQPTEYGMFHTWHSKAVGMNVGVEEELQNRTGAWDGFAGSVCPHGQPGDRLFLTQAATPANWHRVSQSDRFWPRTYRDRRYPKKESEDCLEWMGTVNKKKYGLIKWDRKTQSTHRVAWQIQYGKIPDGMHVLHKCDLPWCVDPGHLFLGNNADNVADKIAKGRVTRKFGQLNKASKLDDSVVAEICHLYKCGFEQEELAIAVGVSQSQISRIVNNKCRKGETTIVQKPLGSRTLEITKVRAERVQDISEEDAKAEGVFYYHSQSPGLEAKPYYRSLFSHRELFKQLWDSIYAKQGFGWDVNPWLWVIEFKKVTT